MGQISDGDLAVSVHHMLQDWPQGKLLLSVKGAHKKIIVNKALDFKVIKNASNTFIVTSRCESLFQDNQ